MIRLGAIGIAGALCSPTAGSYQLSELPVVPGPEMLRAFAAQVPQTGHQDAFISWPWLQECFAAWT